jgi:hypothetical protein
VIINEPRAHTGDIELADLQALYSPLPTKAFTYAPIPANPRWLSYVENPATHSDNATTRTLGYAERLSPDPAYPNSATLAGVSATSTSNPSIASSRQFRSHAPWVNIVATGETTPSNTSAITFGPTVYGYAGRLSRLGTT